MNVLEPLAARLTTISPFCRPVGRPHLSRPLRAGSGGRWRLPDAEDPPQRAGGGCHETELLAQPAHLAERRQHLGPVAWIPTVGLVDAVLRVVPRDIAV